MVYTGNADNAGDLYVRVTHYEQLGTGRKVVMIPAFYPASAAYYDTLALLLREADLVLMEGPAGSAGLSLSLPMIEYTSRLLWRTTALAGEWHPAERISFSSLNQLKQADASFAEFEARASPFMPLLTLVAAAIMEPYVLFTVLDQAVWAGFGRARGVELRHRFNIVSAAFAQNGRGFDAVAPGYEDQRRLERRRSLDAALAQPELRSIAMLWSAGHAPSIQDLVVARGFLEVRHEWICALPIRRVLEEPQFAEARVSGVYLPYALHVRSWQRSTFASVAAGALTVFVADQGVVAVNLLWSSLVSYTGQGEKGWSLQLGPSLRGSPLGLRVARENQELRTQLLWFFDTRRASTRPNLQSPETAARAQRVGGLE